MFKKVQAIKKGFYDDLLRDVGSIFEVKSDLNASWFEDVKENEEQEIQVKIEDQKSEISEKPKKAKAKKKKKKNKEELQT
jgi:hypothetical protein